jgi:hypothetical protein
MVKLISDTAKLVKMHLNRKAVHGLPPDITRAQQDILKRGLGADELAETPQMWAMYKEVMGYFANGVSSIPMATIIDNGNALNTSLRSRLTVCLVHTHCHSEPA